MCVKGLLTNIFPTYLDTEENTCSIICVVRQLRDDEEATHVKVNKIGQLLTRRKRADTHAQR